MLDSSDDDLRRRSQVNRARRRLIYRRALKFAGEMLISAPDVFEGHDDLTEEEDDLLRDTIVAIGKKLRERADQLP